MSQPRRFSTNPTPPPPTQPLNSSVPRSITIKSIIFLKPGKEHQPFVGIEQYPRQVVLHDSLSENDFVLNPRHDPQFCYKKGINLLFEWLNWKSCCFHYGTESNISCLICRKSFCSEECFLNKEHLRYHRNNFLSSNDYSFFNVNDAAGDKVLSNDYYYLPTNSDVGKRVVLRITPRNLHLNPLGKSFCVSLKSILPYSNCQKLSYIRVNQKASPQSHYGNMGVVQNPTKISIFDYNILAAIYVNKDFFPTIKECFLDFEYRKVTIAQTLIKYNSDIICLQEVEHNFFHNYLKNSMDQGGYEGHFKQKTGTQNSGEGSLIGNSGAPGGLRSARSTTPTFYMVESDGCAVFFKREVFTLVEKVDIEFRSEFAKKLIKHGKDTNYKLRKLVKNNIAIVLVLQHNQTQKTVIVACIHIMANNLYKDIKLWQIYCFIRKIEKIKREIERRRSVGGGGGQFTAPYIFLSGDLNSKPTSNVYKFITTGQLRLNEIEERNEYNSYILNTLLFKKNRSVLRHSLNLRSSYTYCNKERKEPEYTNKTINFRGTLDYIFFEERREFQERIKVMKCLSFPKLKENEYIPNEYYPSDHFPLRCTFGLS